MGDQAGPSGAGNSTLGKSVEETQDLFNTGVACIRTNALEMAADIFAQVLRARTARYGDLAPECASSYFRYGSVLLYQAQDNADVFGANLDTDVHQDEENKENHKSDERLEERPSAAEGKNPVSGPEEYDEAKNLGANVLENDSGTAEAGIDATDLEIAWENLDTARAIWEKDPQQYCHDLASVHVLLGDVALENEAFNDSLLDYDHALKYQRMAKYPEDDRRVAEVFFKRVMALQFLERPEDALVDVGNARIILEKRLDHLKQNMNDNKVEIDDVTAILDDLNDKKSELEAQAKEKKAMADAVRGALSQFHQHSKDAPQNELKGTSKSNIASPVKDLGVVGRGTKRINLAPAPADSTPLEERKDEQGPSEDHGSKKSKRTMDDLMGGEDGDTTLGFGN